MNKEEQELLDILQVFWAKYSLLYGYTVENGESPHRDIQATVIDLQNIQNRILARIVKKSNPERFSE